MSDLQDRLARAVSQIGAGQLGEAEALFRDVLREEPSNADALHFLGVILGQRGETAAAIDSIRRAVELRPNAPAFHNNLGKALESAGDLTAAVQSYRRAVELAPGYAGASFNLGTALMARGDVKGAEESLRHVLAIEPQHRGARRNLAATLMRQGRCHEGVGLLEALVAEPPPDVELYRTFIAAILYDPELDEDAKFAV